MKALVIAAVAVGLTACNTVTQQQVDSGINNTVPLVCAGVDLVWAGFEAYKGSHPVKADLVVKANAAYFAAKNVCAAPPTNSTEALLAVVRASSDFNSVIRAAKNGVTT